MLSIAARITVFSSFLGYSSGGGGHVGGGGGGCKYKFCLNRDTFSDHFPLDHSSPTFCNIKANRSQIQTNRQTTNNITSKGKKEKKLKAITNVSSLYVTNNFAFSKTMMPRL